MTENGNCPLKPLTTKTGVYVKSYINLDSDVVYFILPNDNNKVIFSIGPSNPELIYHQDNKEIIVGRFSFNKNYYIKFEFNQEFIKTYNFVNILDTSTPASQDFIDKEYHIVEYLLNNYPEIFKLV